MNSLDLTLLAIVALSSLWGAWRGMFRSVYGLMVIFAAFWMTKSYAPEVFLRLVPDDQTIGSPPFLLATSYILVFLGVLIPLAVLGTLLKKILRELNLVALDRAAGFVFGLARGLLLAFSGVVMFSFLPFIDKKMLGESLFLPAAGKAMQAALKQPQLEKYGRYWTFDASGAPVFNAKALAEEKVLENYLPGELDKSTKDG